MQRKNYIFHYDLNSKKVKGHNLAENTIDKIKELTPTGFTSEDVPGGWIKIVNNKYSNRELRNAKPGKWILEFPQGSKKIDEAWRILADAVIQNDLWEVKVAAKNPQFKNQVICIYTIDQNNLTDIERVYDFLDRHGIVKMHLDEPINSNVLRYKSDEQTMRYKQDTTLLTHQDILSTRQRQQQTQERIRKTTSALTQLIQEFEQLKKQVDQTPHFYSVFYDTKYSRDTLDRIGILKENFIKEISGLPLALRNHPEIKKFTEQGNSSNLIDFHRIKTPFLRLGATRTRQKIDDLLTNHSEEKRLLRTLGRQL